MAQHAEYRQAILGIDPGKQGGFCLLSPCGKNMRLWKMPLTGGKVCPVQIATLYKEIFTLCRKPPLTFVEKAQVMKTDGKVGMGSYFKGYGFLFMTALWDWPIVEVPPGTWCRTMHAGIDGKMHPKDKSRKYIAQHLPHLYVKGSEMWPERMQKPHEGLMDAYMIAEFGRQKTYGQST